MTPRQYELPLMPLMGWQITTVLTKVIATQRFNKEENLAPK